LPARCSHKYAFIGRERKYDYGVGCLIIEVLLSFGAVNALVPLMVIVILIAAAAGLTRGWSVLKIFGIESLMGISAAGKGSLVRKTAFKGSAGQIFFKPPHAAAVGKAIEAGGEKMRGSKYSAVRKMGYLAGGRAGGIAARRDIDNRLSNRALKNDLIKDLNSKPKEMAGSIYGQTKPTTKSGRFTQRVQMSVLGLSPKTGSTLKNASKRLVGASAAVSGIAGPLGTAMVTGTAYDRAKHRYEQAKAYSAKAPEGDKVATEAREKAAYELHNVRQTREDSSRANASEKDFEINKHAGRGITSKTELESADDAINYLNKNSKQMIKADELDEGTLANKLADLEKVKRFNVMHNKLKDSIVNSPNAKKAMKDFVNAYLAGGLTAIGAKEVTKNEIRRKIDKEGMLPPVATTAVTLTEHKPWRERAREQFTAKKAVENAKKAGKWTKKNWIAIPFLPITAPLIGAELVNKKAAKLSSRGMEKLLEGRMKMLDGLKQMKQTDKEDLVRTYANEMNDLLERQRGDLLKEQEARKESLAGMIEAEARSTDVKARDALRKEIESKTKEMATVTDNEKRLRKMIEDSELRKDRLSKLQREDRKRGTGMLTLDAYMNYTASREELKKILADKEDITIDKIASYRSLKITRKYDAEKNKTKPVDIDGSEIKNLIDNKAELAKELGTKGVNPSLSKTVRFWQMKQYYRNAHGGAEPSGKALDDIITDLM
jgi:hypothetical protein